jgi:hypothetical protein
MSYRCTACAGTKTVRGLGMITKPCVTCLGQGFIDKPLPVIAEAIPDLEHVEGSKKSKSKQAEV